jgi:hypothetical protein
MFFANIIKPEQYGRNQSKSYPHKKPLKEWNVKSERKRNRRIAEKDQEPPEEYE